jgi:hypothetical protein
MTPSLLRIGLAALLTLLILTSPNPLFGQNTNANAAEKKASAKPAPAPAKTPSPGPFNGKLTAIDPVAKTIKVGKRTFQITSETKILKAGKPATLADGIVGESASGYVKPTDDGRWLATTVNLGPKPAAKTAEKTPKEVPPKKAAK